MRKWLRRYQQQDSSGLIERSRAPHHPAGKTPRRRAAASSVFAERIQQHLRRCGVDLRHLVLQTDNGSEFIGGHDDLRHPTGFPSALGKSQHVRIPPALRRLGLGGPAAHTCQSDVETVHRLIEDKFLDLESFASRSDFLAKATTYQLYFNLLRSNSHQQNLAPWQIVPQFAPRSPWELCCFRPLFLDCFLNQPGGYDVSRHP